MIAFAPIWAIVLRHTRMRRRDVNYILGNFYWPVPDILIWGFLGYGLHNRKQHHYITMRLQH